MNASREPSSSSSAESPSGVEQRVAELLEEEALDERARRLAARAVGERDDLVAELRPPRLTPGRLAPPREPSVVVVGGAGAFARDHARADRPLGRARGAEDPALPRLDRARPAPRRTGRPSDPRRGCPAARSAPRRPSRRARAAASARCARSSRGRATRTCRAAPSSPRARRARAGCRRAARPACTGSRPRSGPRAAGAASMHRRLQDVDRLERRDDDGLAVLARR